MGANADDEMAEDEDVQERKRKSKQEIITKEHMLALAPKIAHKWRNIAPRMGLDIEKVFKNWLII